ncbi:MAG: type polyketide synthase [Xanthobacteraceae bacterium]|nr:type polyketide synthase [Xanthobacteraceae bacterium]
MLRPVSLLALATAVPPHVIDQQQAEQRAREMFAPAFARFPQLAEVFTNAGIARRHSVRPIEWFDAPRDWTERTKAYLDGAAELFTRASRAALDRAGLKPEDIDTVVTVSSTGIATPSLEARVAGDLGLRPDCRRVPVFGLGCAGGVTGLALASRLARAEPGSVVLMVAVELCTLAFRLDRGGKEDVVATALFGDGAAAALLRAGQPGEGIAQIGAAAEHTWPGTLDIMGWSVDPIGFGVLLSRALPRFVEERLAEPARRFVDDAGLAQASARYLCHPGGAKVLTAVEAALALGDGTLATEREVLRDFGNMSAPSVLFVLERALAQGLTGAAVMSALGPGFTASFLALECGRG